MRTILLAVAFALTGAVAGVFGAAANDNPFVQELVEGCPEGYVCVTVEEYELHWDVCPVDPNFTPTVTDTPTDEPTVTPTPEVTPTPTDDPTDEPRVNCNQGVGNGPDCTPGQSDNTVRANHPQPPNDELDRNIPGNPERKGSKK